MFTAPRPQLLIGHHGPLHLFPCRLPLETLDTHLYVVGRTRTGKSKFLQSILAQLIRQGQGVGLLDPHTDLCDDLLAELAPDLARDPALAARVLYVQPGRDDYLVPLNVLHAPGEPYVVAQNVLEAFRRTWPEALREAPRFANIVLAATLLLIEQRLTLMEMPRLLTDAAYRGMLLSRSGQREVVRFFRGRYDRWGRERATIVESVLNKVGAFVINPRLRAVLGSAANGLPFGEIMDGGRVLLCDLGRVDAETRRLLGSLVVTGLEQAAFRRAAVPRAARRPFTFVIDEFPDYAAGRGSTQSLARILDECRKFRLYLGLAHQNLGQLEGERLRGALENVALKVVFGTGRGTARTLAEELFTPDLAEVKHEVEEAAQRGRTHPAYYSLGEQWERHIQTAQRLPPRHALVQLPDTGRICAVRTPTVPGRPIDDEALETLQRELARASGRSRSELEAAVARREGGGIGLENGAPLRYDEEVDA
jgi:hypothetical protein